MSQEGVDPEPALASWWAPSSWQGPGPFRHPAGIGQRSSEQHLDLRVDAAELVVGPPGQCVMHCGVDPQEDLFTVLAHE